MMIHPADGSAAPASTLRRFFREHVPEGIVSAYLFGSRSRGSGHRESDIDVAILVDRTGFPTRSARSDLRVKLGGELIHALGTNDVDLVVLNDVPPGLGRHVVTSGERVYMSDAEANHAYVRDVQLRAADLAPFLRRSRRTKLRILAS